MKTSQSGFAPIIVIVILLVTAGTITFAASRVIGNSEEQVRTNASEQSSAENLGAVNDGSLSNKPDVSIVLDTEVEQSTFYKVVLADSVEYYGRVQAINDMFFRMSPVYYPNGDVLMVLGDELHGPENAMYVKSDNVATFEELEPGEISTAIAQSYEQDKPAEVSNALPSANIDDFIKDELVQAVFLKDGTSYYVRLNSMDPLVYEGAVYQVRASSGPSVQMNISLAVVPEDEVVPLSSGEVVYWQNLTPGGQISSAITQYEGLQ